jgi:glycosyltransferase involved in cell wall biosynthesis
MIRGCDDIMTACLVSICVPTFNGAPWLAACLESALSQTLSDFEVLVVDDASDDGTVDVAMGFAARDSRVRVERNPERLGLAANWNRCLELANGTWIKFLFQDDELATTCLDRMITVGEEAEAEIVVCDRHVDVSEGTSDRVREYFASLPRMDDLFKRPGDEAGSWDVVLPEEVCQALVAHPGVNFFGEPAAVLLNRSVFEHADVFNTEMIQLCDLEFTARVASNVGFARVREELATFRVHERSTSAANAGAQEFRKDVLDTLVLFHEYAFVRDFAKLRKAAKEAQPSVSFSVLAARELQRAQRDCRESDDAEMRQALDDVLSAHPNLSRPLWQLWHRVRKQLR